MIRSRIFRSLNRAKWIPQVVIKNASSIQHENLIFQEINNKGIITLNRPEAFNALSMSMLPKLNCMLMKCQSSKSLVLINSSNSTAFCVGGDVKQLANSSHEQRMEAHLEAYDVFGLIGRYRVPYVALIDGLVMGGGAGISINGQYRVATERTVFAMPEAKIGYCTDSGSSYFLSKMPGASGTYLALTGERLKGPDVLRAGIATHYCERNNLRQLQDELMKCSDQSDVIKVLDQFKVQDLPGFSLGPYMDQINKYFSLDSVEEIMLQLESDSSKWAGDTKEILRKVAPTSLKVTLKLLNMAKHLSRPQCLLIEFSMAANMMNRNDFKAGVKALLIDKDMKPEWKPSTLANVTEDMISSIFKSIPLEEELRRRFNI